MPDLKVRRVTVSSAAAPIATLGIDFGTTNTVMALSVPGQEAQVVTPARASRCPVGLPLGAGLSDHSRR